MQSQGSGNQSINGVDPSPPAGGSYRASGSGKPPSTTSTSTVSLDSCGGRDVVAPEPELSMAAAAAAMKEGLGGTGSGEADAHAEHDLGIMLQHEDFPLLLALAGKVKKSRELAAAAASAGGGGTSKIVKIAVRPTDVAAAVGRLQDRLLPDPHERRVFPRGVYPITDSIMDDNLSSLQKELDRLEGHFAGTKPSGSSSNKPNNIKLNSGGGSKKDAIAIKYSKWQTDILMSWMIGHIGQPFPEKRDVDALSRRTGLTHSQVINWTTNVRKRNRKATCQGGKKPHHYIDFLFLKHHQEKEAAGAVDGGKKAATLDGGIVKLPKRASIPRVKKESHTFAIGKVPAGGGGVATKAKSNSAGAPPSPIYPPMPPLQGIHRPPSPPSSSAAHLLPPYDHLQQQQQQQQHLPHRHCRDYEYIPAAAQSSSQFQHQNQERKYHPDSADTDAIVGTPELEPIGDIDPLPMVGSEDKGLLRDFAGYWMRDEAEREEASSSSCYLQPFRLSSQASMDDDCLDFSTRPRHAAITSSSSAVSSPASTMRRTHSADDLDLFRHLPLYPPSVTFSDGNNSSPGGPYSSHHRRHHHHHCDGNAGDTFDSGDYDLSPPSIRNIHRGGDLHCFLGEAGGGDDDDAGGHLRACARSHGVPNKRGRAAADDVNYYEYEYGSSWSRQSDSPATTPAAAAPTPPASAAMLIDKYRDEPDSSLAFPEVLDDDCVMMVDDSSYYDGTEDIHSWAADLGLKLEAEG